MNIFSNIKKKKDLGNLRKCESDCSDDSDDYFSDDFEAKIIKKIITNSKENRKSIIYELPKKSNSNLHFFNKKKSAQSKFYDITYKNLNESFSLENGLRYDMVRNFTYYNPHNNIDNIIKKRKNKFINFSNKKMKKVKFIFNQAVNKVRSSMKEFINHKKKNKKTKKY